MGHRKNSRKVSFKRFRRSREKYPGLFESENGINGRLLHPVWGLKGTEVWVKHSWDKKKDLDLFKMAIKAFNKKVENDKIRASTHEHFMSPSERKKQKKRKEKRAQENNN